MDTEKQLDLVLAFLDGKGDWIYSQDLRHKITSDISDTQLDLITDKLFLDGYISRKEETGDNVGKISPPVYCRVTYHGRLFLGRGGYKAQSARLNLMKAWTKTKTIANIANAAAVIGISLFAAYISYSQWQQEDKNNDEIMKAEKRIERLENTFKSDSLNHPR